MPSAYQQKNLFKNSQNQNPQNLDTPNLKNKKVYLKIALNSVPNPPIPIFVKSQSGFIMDCLST